MKRGRGSEGESNYPLPPSGSEGESNRFQDINTSCKSLGLYVTNKDGVNFMSKPSVGVETPRRKPSHKPFNNFLLVFGRLFRKRLAIFAGLLVLQHARTHQTDYKAFAMRANGVQQSAEKRPPVDSSLFRVYLLLSSQERCLNLVLYERASATIA